MYVAEINATLIPISMLIEGTRINCDVGVFWAVFKIGFLREYGMSSDNTCGEPAALCLASCDSCTHIEERVSCTSLLHLNSIGCIRVMRKYVSYAHVFLLV